MEYFLHIEARDGLIECLRDATIQNRISKTHENRVKNAQTRKDVIVGTSTFVNTQESRPKDDSRGQHSCVPSSQGNDNDEFPPDFESNLAQIDKYSLDNFLVASRKNLRSYVSPLASILYGEGTYVEKMKKRRLAESYENLREADENTPKLEMFVANIGKTVKNKPRVDFAISFFEPFDFICQTNDGFENVHDALESVLKMSARVIVLSSTDDLYPEIVPEFARVLKEKAPDKILVLAGYPKEHIETFTEAGVDYFVYMRANLVQTIQDILMRLEEK